MLVIANKNLFHLSPIPRSVILKLITPLFLNSVSKYLVDYVCLH